MDIFDGNILNYLIPIIMIILFSLPDAMRRKRRYPKRQAPQERKRTEPAAQPEARPSPVRQREAKWTQPAQPAEADAAVQLAAYAASLPKQSRSAAPVRLAKPKAEPWSGLSPEARELYAGLVWEELLQPPLARRRKRRQ